MGMDAVDAVDDDIGSTPRVAIERSWTWHEASARAWGNGEWRMIAWNVVEHMADPSARHIPLKADDAV